MGRECDAKTCLDFAVQRQSTGGFQRAGRTGKFATFGYGILGTESDLQRHRLQKEGHVDPAESEALGCTQL